MNYPAPPYDAAAAPAQSTILGVAAGTLCLITTLSILVVGAIALGVGLSVRKK